MAIWDKPLNSNGFGNAKNLSADSAKCPNCGANIVFDSAHGALVCRACGGMYDPETMDHIGSFGMPKPEKDYAEGDVQSEEDLTRQEVVCNSCGAQVVTSKNTASTVCAFCGSPAVVSRRLTREFKPDYIIPFKFDKDQAKNYFEEHIKTIDHLPKSFKSHKTIDKLTALYVPTWVISTDCQVNATGKGKMGRGVDEYYSEYHEEDGRNYSQIAYGKACFRLKNVPFDGEKHIADRLMAAAEPFKFDEMVPFKSEYLQGFLAEKYDELPTDMTDKIYRRLDKLALEVCDKITFGFDAFTTSSDMSTTRYRNQDIKYALLPVWFMSIEYDGIRYQYIVNGQTGKVSGEFPYAKGWETVEGLGRKAKMGSVSLAVTARRLLYALPIVVLGFLRAFGENSRFANSVLRIVFENPLGSLLLAVLIGVLCYAGIEILPKIIMGKEKQMINNLNQAGSHDLAKPQGAEAYFDTASKVYACETNGKFQPLDSGWSYGEKSDFDFRSAAPKVKKDELGEEATEFQKQGDDRRMFE